MGLGVETYGKVAGLAAVVTAAVGTTIQAQGRAVSLDVTEALAVIALLGWMVLAIGDGKMLILSDRLLSVVRGRGQALDSWPI